HWDDNVLCVARGCFGAGRELTHTEGPNACFKNNRFNSIGHHRSNRRVRLTTIPDDAGKLNGIRLGEAVAAKVLAARVNDGADAPDAYRPRTTPGVYVATSMLAASTWPNVKPFALTRPDQFRPGPPVPLETKQS